MQYAGGSAASGLHPTAQVPDAVSHGSTAPPAPEAPNAQQGNSLMQ
jgi:hypothetical protein